MAEAHSADKLERLCRYISRPAGFAEKRLALTATWAGALRAQNSVPQWHHPCGSSSRWTSSPNSLRWYPAASQPHTLPRRLCTEQQTPSLKQHPPSGQEARQIGRSRYSTGVTRVPEAPPRDDLDATLKRVFNIDIEVCEHCGGHVKVIASIGRSEGH